VHTDGQTGDLISLLSFLKESKQKIKGRLMRSPACVSVCVPPVTFEPVGTVS
jgi:hypothetical protein